MTRLGFFCPPAIGHLNPMCALALELQQRGHTIIFFGVPDMLPKIAKFGFEFIEIGRADSPPGTLDANFKALGQLQGREGLKYSINFFLKEMRMLFREAPAAIETAQIDLLIVDQVTSAISTIADKLNQPFVTICNAMMVHREPGVPPYFTHWDYSPTWWASLRNKLGYRLLQSLTRDLFSTLNAQRQQWNLPPYKAPSDAYSPLAQIAQMPADLDFPRTQLADCFHYIGRLAAPSRREPITFDIPFPFDRLDDRPLIYASLGTLQNQRPEIFECIARACEPLEAQLVISLGNPQATPMDLPGNPIVVPFAPHQQLIERASLIITHAGMNTTLTALDCGVPLVAVPITSEQPGIAARLVRSGAGQRIRLKQLDENNLRSAVQTVLTDPSYRQNARRMQQAIVKAGGVERAASMIEQVIQTRTPVLR